MALFNSPLNSYFGYKQLYIVLFYITTKLVKNKNKKPKRPKQKTKISQSQISKNKDINILRKYFRNPKYMPIFPEIAALT